MSITDEMYYKLFNGITDATKRIKKAEEILKIVQIETEEMFIENTDETKVVKLKIHKTDSR